MLAKNKDEYPFRLQFSNKKEKEMTKPTRDNCSLLYREGPELSKGHLKGENYSSNTGGQRKRRHKVSRETK